MCIIHFRRLPQQKYLVVRLEQRYDVNRRTRIDLQLTGFNKDNFRALDGAWRLMAAVEYVGRRHTQGNHYCAWLRNDPAQGQPWLVASDRNHSVEGKLKSNLKGAFDLLCYMFSVW